LPGTGKTNQETISWPKSALYAGSFAKLVGLFIDGLSWSLLLLLPRLRDCMTYPPAPGVHLNLTDFLCGLLQLYILPREIEPASDYSPRLSLAAQGSYGSQGPNSRSTLPQLTGSPVYMSECTASQTRAWKAGVRAKQIAGPEQPVSSPKEPRLVATAIIFVPEMTWCHRHLSDGGVPDVLDVPDVPDRLH